MNPLVIYHYPCVDGFTAAWACWLKHPDWEFYPAKHGDPPPDVTGRDVYFLDFSYKRPVILEMITKVNSLTILDHHKTAEADLQNLSPNVLDPACIIPVNVIFDMEKSGARLTWEYFHSGIQVPGLVKFVEDRDLWRFAYPETKAINAYIFSQEYDFNKWNMLRNMLSTTDNKNYITNLGRAILDKQDKDIKELAVNAFRGTVNGHNVPIVNVPYTYASDMGHFLCKDEPFAVAYYYDGTGFVYSLRSDSNGLDVSEIAKVFGGGGHKNSAGFKIKISPIGEI